VKRIASAVAIGVVAGTVGGLFGIGGGLVLVPSLVLLMHLSQIRAHTNALAATVAVAAAAVARLSLDDRVAFGVAGLILLGSLIGAYAGARLITRIPDIWLAWAFVSIAIAGAVRMALDSGGKEIVEANVGRDISALGAVGLVLIGLVTGALAAVLGIGGGIVYVPALATLYTFQQHLAQGTSLAVIVPTAMVATLVHGRAGRIDWRLVAGLGTGGVIGGLLGAQSALALDGPVLRRMFAGLLVLAAVRMAIRTRRAAPEPAA
jgi:uncharacterized membrane protein YfcA